MTELMFNEAFKINGMYIGLMTGDALLSLKELPSESFNAVVTSPPYYWVRDYNVDGQIGHEKTVEDYVNSLANVCDEIKRVLRPDGVFYLNLGDTYYSGNGQPHGRDPKSPSRNFMRRKLRSVDQSGWDIPKKSLIGVPWKVAFELQNRGWTLRSDIIWYRNNAFSEPSARDRPWRKHEYLFLLSKSRFYAYNREALEKTGTVWDIPIERKKFIKNHPSPFPTLLVEKCILTGSPEGGNILDPFMGSGTTLFVASKLKRNSVGIDLKKEYVEKVKSSILEKGGKRLLWDALNNELRVPNKKFNAWKGNHKSKRLVT